ncbi:MAG: thioesterase family protein [Chloroflexi bacterium]|jgi:fluoroacetyl-CoA thioesterase|nr:thioesterase family protein [Anaerolineaceae bacterium]NMB86968.1 thioesterase family protein [Chloroflexota bacterium]
MAIEPGLVGEHSIIVSEEDTARASGGESLPPVLSTPRLVGLLERTAHQAILPFLGEGQSSVGTLVNIRHLAATPVGMPARFRAELLEADGRRLRFKVEAWDAVDKIAEGEHERFVIDQSRFNERLEKKSLSIGK